MADIEILWKIFIFVIFPTERSKHGIGPQHIQLLNEDKAVYDNDKIAQDNIYLDQVT